jgi:hypothetical protein
MKIGVLIIGLILCIPNIPGCIENTRKNPGINFSNIDSILHALGGFIGYNLFMILGFILILYSLLSSKKVAIKNNKIKL